MFKYRLSNMLTTIVLAMMMALTACAPQRVEPMPIATLAQQDKPIALRLAVADGEGYPSERYVLEFVDQVNILSNGNITIEPVWSAGDSTDAGFETGVIQLVKKGEVELGLAGSRAFDTESITSFQALQTPFVIDNDALAIAVAMSEIRTQMLDDLSSAGMAGLTLWPEDLRHPFSLLPDKPMLSPDDLAGLNFRIPSSEASNTLFSSLGAIPMFADSGYEAGESGLSQGASLSGAPTFTGNITFFAKYQVLFTNSAAIEKLSEEQRAVLRKAAAATQKKAIAEHPSDVEAGAAWCADGGSIVLASDTQVAAFEKAAQPVFDSMKQYPLNAELIAAIRELKANTQPSARAQACVPDIAQQSSDTNTETEVWSEGLPPNGVWQVEVTTEELVQMGLRRSIAEEWAGVTILTLQDGKGKYDWSSNTEIYIYSCLLDYVVVGNNVHLTYSAYSASVHPDECEGVIEDLQWRLDDDGLHFYLLAAQNAPFAEDKASWEAKPFQKIADQ